MKSIKLGIPIVLFTLVLSIVSCNEQKKDEDAKIEVSPNNLSSLGDSLTRIAQGELLKNVGREMKAGGPLLAIDFCNLNASTIMDSLSQTHNATISRISEKNRNENNAATNSEKELLQLIQSASNQDTLIVNGSNTNYYKSIYLGMETCLKCHGNREQISPEVQELITERYPQDKATGYQLGDFRGAWKIEFKK